MPQNAEHRPDREQQERQDSQAEPTATPPPEIAMAQVHIGRTAYPVRPAAESAEVPVPPAESTPQVTLSWDEYVKAFSNIDVEPTRQHRTVASSACYRLADHAIRKAMDAGEGATADMKVVHYVTDPETGERHRTVSVNEIQELLADPNIFAIGPIGRKALERIVQTYLPTEQTPPQT
jgi:hypothetical protein